LFLSLYTALFTIVIILVFVLQDLRHKNLDDERTVATVSKMLAYSMRLPLYSNNHEELQNIATQAIQTFHISKIQILHPDGSVYLEVPPKPIPRIMASNRMPIVLTQTLDPIAAISGDNPPEQLLGFVVASTLGVDRMRELYLAMSYLTFAGVTIWLIGTYFGYQIMRRLTKSFDNLIVAIDDIERGKSETIEIKLQDEAEYIASSINRLSLTLHERERQNKILQHKLVKQMERRAKNAEQTMQAKLAHSDKMASLGMLVGCMGHEINNPNALIRLQVENIKSIVTDAKPILQEFAAEEGTFFLGGMPYPEASNVMFDCIDNIYNQTVRIEQVITELRNYTTADSNNKQMISLDSVLLGTMILIDPEIRRFNGQFENKVASGNRRTEKQNIKCSVIERRAKIFANQYSLQQVIVNLVLNAIRATKDMGDKARISINIVSHNYTVELIVADNGIGIHPDEIPKLCDPYFSKHMESGGTGLGLFIANQIISDHNATMVFKSELGKGTTVHLKFPAERVKNT
jgi:two-component system, NtrC family, sensor kinase